MATCTVVCWVGAVRLREHPASMFMAEKRIVHPSLTSVLRMEATGASKPLYRQTTQHYITEDIDFAHKEVVSVLQYTPIHFQPNQPLCYSMPVLCYDIFYPLLCCSKPEQTLTCLPRRYRLFPAQIKCTVYWRALRHEPEGRGFNSRWCHWNFSLT
jgi:hypothetical protein